ncbi:MAG: alpha/beta hydrolase [Chloroflexaceae bacterium]|nr:alpha/beta hydrolase [Chloroflexaceae bacterium]
MQDELICFFERPGAAHEARRELRALQKELRLGRLPSIAVVTRPARDSIQFEQDGNLGAGDGMRFGLVVGAVLGAVLLAPFVGILVAGNARQGLATAPSVDNWVMALALVVAFASGLTALLSALGGALLGGLAAALINFGIGSRKLYAIGEELAVGQAALVTRVSAAQRPPIADLLALSGGALMRPREAGRAGAPPGDDPTAAGFAARAYDAGVGRAGAYVPITLETPPVDPRQRDLVVAECADAAHARRAARGLRRLRRTLGGLAAGNHAIVTRDEQGRAGIQQAENVTAGRGALVGGLAGAAGGLLVGGAAGAALAGLALMVNQGTTTVPANAGGFILAVVLVLGAMGAVVFGLGGGLLGASVAHLVNLAYKDADLRRIAETVPPGKALLIASIYHHAGPATVQALRAEGATIRHLPLPAAQLVDATIDEERRAALSLAAAEGPETRQLIPTRSGVRIFADWHRHGPRTIVLLHGAGGDHDAWRAQYPALHGAGFSTLALDLRGHGYSDRPRDAEDYRLERFAEDVYDVLEALAIRDFIMVGHCFGGMVTTMFHQAHPHLSKGYLLLDTAARAPAAPGWVATRAPWVIGMLGRLLELLPADRRALLPNTMDAFKGTGDIQLNRLMADASHTTLRAWLMIYRGIAQYDGVASLRSMTQPVWVVVGEEDTVFTVEDSKIIQRHVPGSRLITVPGANHIIVVNNPEVVEQVILDFIYDTGVFERRAAVATARATGA